MHLYSNSSKIADDIKKSKQWLSDELIQSNLPRHTYCSSGTTSRLHSVGSGTVLQKLLKNHKLQNLLWIFSLASDRKEILQAGEKILLLLLGGKRRRKKTLDKPHVHNYMRKCQDSLGTPSKFKLVDPLHGCKIVCALKNCTCRQYRFVCTNICSDCRGLSWMNYKHISDTDPW